MPRVASRFTVPLQLLRVVVNSISSLEPQDMSLSVLGGVLMRIVTLIFKLAFNDRGPMEDCHPLQASRFERKGGWF